MNLGSPNTVYDDLKAAEAALEAARQMAIGPERFEALKKAGQLRYDADKRRLKSEDTPSNKRASGSLPRS
jgi:hypothetical protein